MLKLCLFLGGGLIVSPQLFSANKEFKKIK